LVNLSLFPPSATNDQIFEYLHGLRVHGKRSLATYTTLTLQDWDRMATDTTLFFFNVRRNVFFCLKRLTPTFNEQRFEVSYQEPSRAAKCNQEVERGLYSEVFSKLVQISQQTSVAKCS
jgi:hypothetical protein